LRGLNDIGVSYEHGYGVATDAVLGARLYRSACDGGNAVVFSA